MQRVLEMVSLTCVLGGCTSINSDYDPGGGGGAGTAGATSSGSTSSTQTTASEADSGGPSPPPPPMTTSQSATTMLDSSGDEPTCALGGLEFRLSVFNGTGDEIPPDCSGAAPVFALGRVSATDNGYESQHCGSCDCEPPDSARRRVVLEGLDPLPFDACGRLVVWDAFVDGECEHAGVAVTSPAFLPEWIAARTLELPTDVDLAPDLSLEDRELCPSKRCPETGTQALVVLGDTVIEVGESAELTFDGPQMSTYDVFNHRSEVTEACKQAVVWTADRRRR